MNHNKLLTISDLYNFYSTKKKSMSFDSKKSGYNIAVQTKANFETSSDLSEGLLYGKIRAFHDLTNNNKSHIETDVLEEKMVSLADRPIIADIVETAELDSDGNPIKDFSGHTMEYDEEKEKFIYKELPVGHCVNPDSIHLEYDEEYERNFVVSDVVIYEEYTDACEILRRRETVDCSVELIIKEMHWNNADKVLVLDDFFVQGVTLLGAAVLPGMSGSKLSLKDFSEENNSLFSFISDDSQSRLIETLDKLNDTLGSLSSFNINIKESQKGGTAETMFNELLKKYNKTVDNITFDYEGLSDAELEAKFVESFADDTDEPEEETDETPIDDSVEDIEDDVVEDPDNDTVEDVNDNSTEDVEDDIDEPDDDKDTDDVEDDKKDVFTKTFEISHEELTGVLYKLLAPLEETLNECYWIVKTFDDHFIYQGRDGRFYDQKYIKDGDDIVFDGERIEVFAEFITAEEKAEIENMRANYSSISAELAKYKEAEDIADKMTIFEDEAYGQYLETNEFKSLMDAENLKKFTKEELIEKADAALGKLNRITKTFAIDNTKNEEKKKSPSFFAFARVEHDTSFLDGLLNK